MDKETKDIIKLIAGIQIESLTSLKKEIIDGRDSSFEELVTKLLGIVDKKDILTSLDDHIRFYTEVENTPTLLILTSEYQLLVCSHILFRMEEEWIQTNCLGVINCWDLLRRNIIRNHPEFNLLY